MKLIAKKDDLLIALQDLVCSQVGENTVIKSFEFIGEKNNKIACKFIEIEFFKQEEDK